MVWFRSKRFMFWSCVQQFDSVLLLANSRNVKCKYKCCCISYSSKPLRTQTSLLFCKMHFNRPVKTTLNVSTYVPTHTPLYTKHDSVRTARESLIFCMLKINTNKYTNKYWWDELNPHCCGVPAPVNHTVDWETFKIFFSIDFLLMQFEVL